MNISSDARERLLEIERILTETVTGVRSNGGAEDSVAVHLAQLPAARIRAFTQMLEQRVAEVDDVDALAMRLLINDYTTAVAHLRAVAQVAASLVDGAAAPVKRGHKFLLRDEKRRHNQDAATALPAAGDQPT